VKLISLLLTASLLLGQFYTDSGMILTAEGDSLCVEERQWVAESDTLLMNYPCEPEVVNNWKAAILFFGTMGFISWVLIEYQRGQDEAKH